MSTKIESLDPKLQERVRAQIRADVTREYHNRLSKIGKALAEGDVDAIKLMAEEQRQKEKKRIRQHRGLFDSKLELDFNDWLKCDPRFVDCKIRPKGIRFRLPGGVFYTPDFVLTRPGSNYLTCFEVKGPPKSKGVAKGLMALKLAAGCWPEIGWRLVWKDAGQWQEQQVHSE